MVPAMPLKSMGEIESKNRGAKWIVARGGVISRERVRCRTAVFDFSDESGEVG